MTPPKKKTKKRKKKTQAQKDREARAAWLEPLKGSSAIVGIDCGARSGICVWRDFLVEQPDYWAWSGASLSEAIHDIAPPGVRCVVALERTVYGPKSAAVALAEYRGMVLAAAWAHGMDVIQVSPQTWQAAIFGPRDGKRDTKALSIEHARRITGNETIADHNVADAICIAEWARREREKMQ